MLESCCPAVEPTLLLAKYVNVLVVTEETKNDPSARLNPEIELANALIVIGSFGNNPCALCVVTVS